MSTPPKVLTLKLTMEVTRVEVVCALRHLRSVRAAYAGDLLTLQERTMQRGGDIVAQSAIMALAAELDLLDGVIRKHWAVLGISATDDHLEDSLRVRQPPYPPASEPDKGGA